MARKAAKKVAAKSPTKSAKTKKAIIVKSVKPAKMAVAKAVASKKPPRKVTRRSAAEVAKLRKAVRAGLKARKLAADLAEELGISKSYLYVLNRA